MKYIAGLNSLRFLAFLAIFLFHTSTSFSLGYLGVDFFFVLSSFLLTLIALNEIEQTGTFNPFNFLIRRVLRIFPLYFLVVAFSFLAIPYLVEAYNLTVTLPEKEWMYWTFLSNFENSDSLFALKFLWSIAVEEQFYLLFIPLSLLFKRYFGVAIGLLLVIYFTFMIYAQQSNIPTYTHTLTHFSNFGIGMLSAYLYFKKIKLFKIAAVSFIFCVIAIYFTYNIKIIFHLLSSILFSSIIILTIEIANKFNLIKIIKPIEFLGKYSYGLYVYSGFILTLGLNYLPIDNNILLFITQLIILIVVSFLSYHLFERQFLKLKKHFR